MEFNTRKLEFTVPSGHKYSIREQNGEDEDILSNPVDAKNLMNLTKFIVAIVVDTDFTKSGKLTVKDALDMPMLDRYCILLQSRIFSLGSELVIPYQWPDSKVPIEYEEDLNNYLLESYTDVPSEEELDSKPYAVPMYPNATNLKDLTFPIGEGKNISFDCFTASGEQYLLGLSEDKRTRNAELIARNLRLEVNGKYEKVTNFSMFSVREMAAIRKLVASYDPVFQGVTELTNPNTGETLMYPVMASPNFFFLTEA